MALDDLKNLLYGLLREQERLWEENVALRMIVEGVTMHDGTKGIPGYQAKIDEWLTDPQVREVTRQKFAPLYEKIEHVRLESELQELLRQLQPTGRSIDSVPSIPHL